MKIFIRILLFVAGLFLLIWLAFSIFAAPFIKSTIEDKLTYYQSDSISIGSVQINFFPVGLKIKDAYLDLYLPLDTVLVKWNGEIGHAKVAGIDWYKAWKNKEWDVASIQIGEGALRWRVTQIATIDTARFEVSTGKVKPDILLRQLQIENLDLKLARDSFAISLQTSLTLDSLSITRSDSVQWRLRRAVLHSEDAIFKNVVEDFDLKYKSLDFDSRDSALIIGGFEMTPRLTSEEFADKYPFRKAQPDLFVSTTTLSGIDLGLINRGLFARKLTLDSCDIKIYQDIRKDRPEVRKPLPSEMIAKIPIPMEIDSVVVKRAYLDYNHKGKTSEKGLANLKVDQLTLKIFPVSNLGHTTAADVNISASARLQNKALVKMAAQFFPDKPNHDFEVDLSMSETPIAVFNDMLYPTIGIKAKSGYCSGAKVYMAGNDYEVRGDLDIAYTDLKIAIPPNQKGQKIFGKVAEGLGNFALVNSNNTMDADKGTIYYKRPAKEPFVNFWWKGIESGLLDAIIRFYQNPDQK